MPQHDLVIDNASGAAVRADLNNALAALGSAMKGPNAPPAPVAGMFWVDDDTPSATVWTLKQYDGADWLEIGRLDVTNNIFIPSEGVIAWADVASAATTDIGAAASRSLRITGTTTITSFGTAPSGVRKRLRIATGLTITHNATSLICPGAASLVLGAGDIVDVESLGSSNWLVFNLTRADGIHDSARWVQISSTAITAVSQIDLTWTGGAYLAYKIYVIGAKPASATANQFFLRVRRGGSTLSGATDYNNASTWWDGATGNAFASGESYMPMSTSLNGEPAAIEIDLTHAASAERIITQARSRYTSNTPAHSRGWFTSNIAAGSGWLDGASIGITGATNFAAVGRIVVMGMKS
jgi:hypothetical protein